MTKGEISEWAWKVPFALVYLSLSTVVFIAVGSFLGIGKLIDQIISKVK